LVLIQTRRGDDPVLDALVRADFDDLVDEDRATARLLALPPYGAVAEVTGEGAAEFVAGLADSPWRVSPTPEGFVVRGPNPEELGRALRVLARPAARVRVAVH
jgi:primosomal protein N'